MTRFHGQYTIEQLSFKGVQIPYTRLPRQLNFVRWHLILVGPLVWNLLHATLLATRILAPVFSESLWALQYCLSPRITIINVSQSKTAGAH